MLGVFWKCNYFRNEGPMYSHSVHPYVLADPLKKSHHPANQT